MTERYFVRADGDVLGVMACVLAAALLFGAGYAIWQNIAENLHLVALVSSLTCYLGAFAVVCFGLTARRYARAAAIAAIFLAFSAQSANYVLFKVPYYDSDAMLFNAYSAQLLTEGVDPYTQSMQPGYRIFGVPEGEATPTINGGTVFAQSYPALSFLVYVPFLWLGITNLLWVSILGAFAILVILIVAAPPTLKPLAPMALFLDPSYFDYTVGGVTDVLWVPCAMLAAMWWRRSPVLSALALAAACSFKQTPWLVVPFAVIWWTHTAVREKRMRNLLYPALAGIALTAVVNLPFVLWHPKSWLQGVLTPLSGQLILFGSGLVQLISSGLVAADPRVLSAISYGVLIVLIVVYTLFPRRFGFLPFIAPAIACFFAPRSLQNYFMYWPIVLLVYLFVNGAEDRAAEKNESFATSKGYAIASLILLVLAGGVGMMVHSRRVVAVKIVHAWVSPITNRIQQLDVVVRNMAPSKKTIRFNFTSQGDGYDYEAWLPKQPHVLPARSEQKFRLAAPSADAQAALDSTTAGQIVAVQGSGRQEYSRAVDFGDVPPKLQNNTFTMWSYTVPPYPVGWDFRLSDLHRWRIRPAFIAGRHAVRLRVPATMARSPWQTAMVAQLTDARAATLRFFLYPQSDYAGGVEPARMFGGELRDVLGHEIFITINSRLHRAVYYRTGARLIISVPGRLDRWNAVDVDLSELHRKFGFALSPSATMLISGIAVVHDKKKEPLIGFFGGVSAWDASPSLVSFPE